MGLFNWLTTPKAELLYTDDQGNQHRLTTEQYGNKCVEWAVGMGKMNSRELGAFGKVRNSPDVIAKIRHVPFIAVAHGTAFFVAVCCTYPVIRLGISNELFKDIMQGVKNTILGGGYLFNGHPTTPEYLHQLTSEVSQYTAILLETAGVANQLNQDRMLFGVGGACQRLIVALDHEYAGVPVPQESNDDEAAPTTKSTGGNWGDGSFKNPAIEATRSVDSETLLASTFANAATQFVKGTDSRRSLVLLQ